MPNASPPVVFLTFANSPDREYLQALRNESALLRDLFSPLHRKGVIELVREESLEGEELPRLIRQYKDRLLLFHFAGHADGSAISLEDGEHYSAGLARVLGLEGGLQFLFLNGCATQEQAAPYLEAGIPVVLATTRAISDADAVRFADHFYHALVHDYSLQDAYTSAVGALKARTDAYQTMEEEEILTVRGIGIPRDQYREQPWRLYVQEGQTAALDWKLTAPEARQNRRPLVFGLVAVIALAVVAYVLFNREPTSDLTAQLIASEEPTDSIGTGTFEFETMGQLVAMGNTHRDTARIEPNGRVRFPNWPQSANGESLHFKLLSDAYELEAPNRPYPWSETPIELTVRLMLTDSVSTGGATQSAQTATNEIVPPPSQPRRFRLTSQTGRGLIGAIEAATGWKHSTSAGVSIAFSFPEEQIKTNPALPNQVSFDGNGARIGLLIDGRSCNAFPSLALQSTAPADRASVERAVREQVDQQLSANQAQVIQAIRACLETQ